MKKIRKIIRKNDLDYFIIEMMWILGFLSINLFDNKYCVVVKCSENK